MQNKSNKLTLIFIVSTITLLLISTMFYLSNTLSHSSKKADTKTHTASQNSNTEFTKMTESDIKNSNDKVNIYIFWGDGCPHCKHLAEFFNEHKSEVEKMANLYTLEVWKNSDNQNFMKNFGKFLGETPKGVPYFIIGNKTFSGYSESDTKTKNQILETIKTEFQKSTKTDKYQEYKKSTK
jgi:putative membrane protein